MVYMKVHLGWYILIREKEKSASSIHYNIQSLLLNLKIFKWTFSNYNEQYVAFKRKQLLQMNLEYRFYS